MLKDSYAFSGFSVDDLAAAEKFYGGNTWFRNYSRKQHADATSSVRWNNTGVFKGAGHEPASYAVLNFPVDDIDTIADELIVDVVTFEIYDGMHQDEKGIVGGKAANAGSDIAWFKDPVGNTLSILKD